MHQTVACIGSDVVITFPSGYVEVHVFDSPEEAAARAAFVAEAVSWIGTPFRDCADVKGPDGAVDCAMLLTRCAVDSGLLPPFDPRPYKPRWHLHRAEELFLGWVSEQLGGIEVDTPRVGDVILWQFARCFSHGAVMVNSAEVVHAWAVADCVMPSRLDEHELQFIGYGRHNIPRPRKCFDVWQGSAKCRGC